MAEGGTPAHVLAGEYKRQIANLENELSLLSRRVSTPHTTNQPPPRPEFIPSPVTSNPVETNAGNTTQPQYSSAIPNTSSISNNRSVIVVGNDREPKKYKGRVCTAEDPKIHEWIEDVSSCLST
ncbi:hypothetical protein SNE40_013186 [Patella caerulea]|uniref:Uncharacterized protein n=1 Tax=Patella caerulea TaxID=87958 RepID=A0AAN8PTA9_PATCE